jgi:hypothetical protein
VPVTVTRNGFAFEPVLYAVFSAVWRVPPLVDVMLRARLDVGVDPTLMIRPPGVSVAFPAVMDESVVAVSVLIDNVGAEPLPTYVMLAIPVVLLMATRNGLPTRLAFRAAWIALDAGNVREKLAPVTFPAPLCS